MGYELGFGVIMLTTQNFLWEQCPAGERLIEQALSEAVRGNHDLKSLEERLLSQTSSRLFDWVDHVVMHDNLEEEVLAAGFQLIHASLGYRLYAHPGAQLPKVVLKDRGAGVAVAVESLADFLLIRGQGGLIEGTPLSGFRRCLISDEGGISFWVVERRSSDGIEPTVWEEGHLSRYLHARELWCRRLRNLEDEEEALALSLRIAQEMVELTGEAMAATIVLEAERAYWQSKNRAGQIQKSRQDALGMGWANHDHHTFRSSRKHFQSLVRLFEILGFRSRERFYAGKEAGWGAQVMEHKTVRLVLFLDVDLLPEELNYDFTHHPLPETAKWGTVGLWCALHGDSILKAGMHHLEAQFLFDELKKDLREKGVAFMAPFSDFSYLKQAFSEGEYWPVDPKRLDLLLRKGAISPEQKEHFARKGAIGSHLENLQRREGYKGFNKNNVSTIIKETDPRHY